MKIYTTYNVAKYNTLLKQTSDSDLIQKISFKKKNEEIRDFM